MRLKLAGFAAFLAFLSTAQAANLIVTDARVEGARLIVKGITPSAHQSVKADGRFSVTSNASHEFSFSISDYMPPDCVVEVTVGNASGKGVVANCGPSGVAPRGAWAPSAKYLQNDLATFQGSTWRAKLFNNGKQPNKSPALWEQFAARGDRGPSGSSSGTVRPLVFQDSGVGPAGEFGLAYETFGFDNGPSGQQNYNDHVWAFGYNVGSQPGFRKDPNQPSLDLRFESKYYSGNTFGSEFHLANITTAPNGQPVERRPISFFLPADGGAGSIGGVQSDKFTINTLSGTNTVQFNNLEPTVDLLQGTAIRAGTNNVALLKQRSASGGFYVDLLKLNGGDVAQIGAPMWVLGARAAAGATYPGEFVVLQPTTANPGDTAISLKGPAVTGTYNASYLRADASAGSFSSLVNYSQNPAANATEFVQVHVGSGDPQVMLDIAGKANARWTVGVDNSDGAKFKIARSGSLGSNDIIVVDSNSATFSVAPKVPSYTVATAPSAAAAGPGAMIFITDDINGPVMAYSDGNAWHRVTDGGIITSGSPQSLR